jgi:hypothetical protein
MLDSMLVLWASLTPKSSDRAARGGFIHKAVEQHAGAVPGYRRRPSGARKRLISNGYSCCAAIF